MLATEKDRKRREIACQHQDFFFIFLKPAHLRMSFNRK
jgi:hypothetical protein